jgi:UDP-glucose 4-epimerase
MPDASFFSGKKILVTGAAGFLGEYLCKYLKRQGCVVFGLDRDNSHLVGTFEQFVVGELAEAAQPCIRDFEPAVVFHLAGAASVADSMRDPFADFDNSVPQTAKLLAAAVAAARRPDVVFFSSAAVYGEAQSLPIDENCPLRPLSPYGAHKAVCEALLEHYARIYDLQVSILRIFSAYGEGLRRQFFWDFAMRAYEAQACGAGHVSVLGAGDESRDFIHAADVARAACRIAQRRSAGVDVYNVAAGEETTVSWVAEHLLRRLGLDLEFQFNGLASPGYPRRWRADTRRLEALGFGLERPLASRLPDLAAWIAAERSRMAT